MSAVRLRLWDDPQDGYCNLERTNEMAKRIKNDGMELLLDFHYSDYWADPGKQYKPKTWKNLYFEALKKAIYHYTNRWKNIK